VYVVFLILTGLNLAEAIEVARHSNAAVWTNAGVLGPDEVVRLRAAGLDLTIISRWIDPFDRSAVDSITSTIREHHPGQMLAVEWPAPAGALPL